MDQFDWTEGVYVKQLRAKAEKCTTTKQLGLCYPELLALGSGDNASFGYNWTHPTKPPAKPWMHYSTSELGGDPEGLISAAVPSMRKYDADGYVALAIPFFSDTFLPEQHGLPAEVTDYRNHYVNTTNGRTPAYYCIRVSHDGRHIKQLCDPGTNGDGTGAYTGAVRATIEEWWNDLKRGHFIDAQSRMVAIILQLKSNIMGIRYRTTLMFELTALGAILPGYDVETRLLDSDFADLMPVWANVALSMVIFFAVLEVFEMAHLGAYTYLCDIWNLMDWANYIIFVIAYINLSSHLDAVDDMDVCTSYLCEQVGYFDDWETMRTFRTTKVYLSLCTCIQLFKVLKFLAMGVPKMGLATAVLRKCAVDLLFFGITFVVTMASFSMMLFVQLGPQMEGYWDQIPAFISLFRALFGDFDIDAIMNNSSGYLNTLLFLGYLFVAIFIMLSMFLAILAEAQVAVREDEQKLEDESDGAYKSYGVFETIGELSQKYIINPAKQRLFKRQGRVAAAADTASTSSAGHQSRSTTGVSNEH